ncbi:MAG TPA: hypothetical protein VF808_18065 [Ktedonobacterales bacterium]
MSYQWLLALQITLPALVIPIVILAGHRMRGGPATLLGAGAPVALLTLWLLGQTGAIHSATPEFYAYVETYLVMGAGLLLLAGWAATLASAISERRWGWSALLTLAVYLSVFLFVAMLLSPSGYCVFDSQSGICSAGQSLILLQFLAATLIGPAAILAYTLLARQPTFLRPSRAQPDGLLATPLGAPDTGPLGGGSGNGEPGAGAWE